MTGYLVPAPLVVSPKATVEANTQDATLDIDNMGKIQTNTGAAGAVALTLPKAADVAGCAVKFQVTAAQLIKAVPAAATEKIYLGGSGVANKYLQIAGVIGNFIDLYSDGTDWIVVNYAGVATKEA